MTHFYQTTLLAIMLSFSLSASFSPAQAEEVMGGKDRKLLEIATEKLDGVSNINPEAISGGALQMTIFRNAMANASDFSTLANKVIDIKQAMYNKAYLKVVNGEVVIDKWACKYCDDELVSSLSAYMDRLNALQDALIADAGNNLSRHFDETNALVREYGPLDERYKQAERKRMIIEIMLLAIILAVAAATIGYRIRKKRAAKQTKTDS